MDFNGLSATNGESWATPGGAQSGRRRTMSGPPRRPALGQHALQNRDQRHWGRRHPRPKAPGTAAGQFCATASPPFDCSCRPISAAPCDPGCECPIVPHTEVGTVLVPSSVYARAGLRAHCSTPHVAFRPGSPPGGRPGCSAEGAGDTARCVLQERQPRRRSPRRHRQRKMRRSVPLCLCHLRCRNLPPRQCRPCSPRSRGARCRRTASSLSRR